MTKIDAEVIADIARIRNLIACQAIVAAEARIDALLARLPDHPVAIGLKGVVALSAGRIKEGLDHCLAATRAEPDRADLHLNLGHAFNILGLSEGAALAYRQVLVLEPAHVEAASALFYMAQQLCDWPAVAAWRPRIRRLVETDAAISPFRLLAVFDDPALHRRAAERFARQFVSDADSPTPPPAAARTTRPLRIGYLSADYRQHATAILMADLIESHDRARVQPIGLSYGYADDSAMMGRIQKGFDAWIDLAPLSDSDAAAAIAAAGIDIAIDLKGYTAGSRPAILAGRPAPVQVAWLGYPGTSGMPWIDYVLADRHTVPPTAEADWSEAVIRLPVCYQPNDRLRPRPDLTPSRHDLGLPDDAMVFCCFNNTFKITAVVFTSWMRILAAVPESLLWLLGTSDTAAARIRDGAGRFGIDPARVVFAPRADFTHHLARHRAADLFLDTWPYGAHTTASDALWMGLPVLTMAGQSFAARVASSIDHAVGLPALVQASPDAYVAAAVGLAGNRALLSQLRAHLDQARDQAPLFDTPRLARALENTYAWMTDRAASGLPPISADVVDHDANGAPQR